MTIGMKHRFRFRSVKEVNNQHNNLKRSDKCSANYTYEVNSSSSAPLTFFKFSRKESNRLKLCRTPGKIYINHLKKTYSPRITNVPCL